MTAPHAPTSEAAAAGTTEPLRQQQHGEKGDQGQETAEEVTPTKKKSPSRIPQGARRTTRAMEKAAGVYVGHAGTSSDHLLSETASHTPGRSTPRAPPSTPVDRAQGGKADAAPGTGGVDSPQQQ